MELAVAALPGQKLLVMEVGEAAEQRRSIFSQPNKYVVEAFEKNE